jgi:hypothetical protein
MAGILLLVSLLRVRILGVRRVYGWAGVDTRVMS